MIFLFLINFLLIYARFIEPNIIVEKYINIETGFKARIVLISDIHIGAYNSTKFLKRIVEKVNNIKDVDFIVIPGDITYYPTGDLTTRLSPLKNLKRPTYAVLGNHDSQAPGPDIEEELKEALEKNNVIFLKNEDVYIEDLDIHILGFGDIIAKEVDIKKLKNYKSEDNLLAIAHSPDTVYSYKDIRPDLTLSGHTHGGQIRIPFIYKYFIPSRYNFDEGYYETEKGKVFVSSGLGMTGLPFRLGIPPVIDVLELY
ncbi:MAG: metallophosphoesterase [Candidatus Dojkabacteria bacterium]